MAKPCWSVTTCPNTLVLLDAEDLTPLKVIPVRDTHGNSSRVSAVYQAAPRGSYVAALKDVPEVWEIRYDSSQFPVRKIRLQQVLDDFFFDQDYRVPGGCRSRAAQWPGG